MGRRENIRRAKDIIAANRNISISEYENHVAEVSSAYPEFKRITTLLAGTGPRIMAASLGKMLEEDSIESIRAEYEALAEQKRRFLVSHGYPEDYCDIKYRCEKCSDTGYVGIIPVCIRSSPHRHSIRFRSIITAEMNDSSWSRT